MNNLVENTKPGDGKAWDADVDVPSHYKPQIQKFLKKNKANLTNLCPPTKGYLRETCKSQNINPIYLTLSSPTVSFRS